MSDGTVDWRDDWQVFGAVRTLYLHEHLPPLLDIKESVEGHAKSFMTSPMRRFWLNLHGFRTKVIKEIGKERRRLWAGDGPFELHLIPLGELLQGTVEELVRNDGLPARWRPGWAQEQLTRGLECVDDKLTERQQESFHLRAIIGVSPEDAARAMNVDVRTANAHLSNGWAAIRKSNIDLQVMRWFLERGTDGTFTVQRVRRIEDEMEEEAARARQTANADAESEDSASQEEREDSYEGI
ncbi:hypothetical protein [Streptomyces sp. NPDC015414]|uniref:hypothetical protein n=1 Tax=Streptomyces sp. NPDC015414 TaxID=3364957 RepID=UPI0036F55500